MSGLLAAAALATAAVGGEGTVCAAGVVSVTESAEPVMGSVPYFRDDAGRSTQTVGDYLYGYWDRRLCRYDLKTMEETVLYEASSSQQGDFCVWGDYVYFMVVPNVTAVGSLHGSLYRVRCDGSEEAVCLTSVRMPGQVCGGQYYEYYKLDTYDDVLYLINQNDYDDHLCFRLNRDGSIARISESETLYGKLPEGYSAKWYIHGLLLTQPYTLPYAMRNYGYVFARDEKDNLVRIDLDSQQAEPLIDCDKNLIRAITNDAVVYSNGGVWYRVSLDDISEIEEIGGISELLKEMPRDYFYGSWGRDGLYFLFKKENNASLLFVSWEGEQIYLQKNFTITQQHSPVEYFGEKEYYYVAGIQGEEVVRRFGLTEDAVPEQVAVYGSVPSWGISARETYDYSWKDDYTGARVDFDITEVHFKDDSEAFARINDFLDDLYAQDMDSMEFYKEAVNEDFDWEQAEKWGAEYVEYSSTYDVCYQDEDYVGIASLWYEYWKGAAHGMHGTVYYMFDRHTGKRVFITDVVDNSAEEICEIMAPYVEAAASWGTGDEGWETAILDEGRFFLSGDGIGIHFDVYEINAYANGDQEIIVPYGAFELRRR